MDNYIEIEKYEDIAVVCYINSTAELKFVKGRDEVFGSATEGALLKYSAKKGLDYKKYREKKELKH